MANFLKGALGNDGVAEMAGKKAGEFVEQTVKNVMSGKGKEGAEKKEGGGGGGGGAGGFGLGDAVSKDGGKKDDGDGGFGLGDALSMVSGTKDEGGEGGLDVGKLAGGLFK